MGPDEEQVLRIVRHDYFQATVTSEGLLGKFSLFVFEGTVKIDLSAPRALIAFRDSTTGDVYGLFNDDDNGNNTPFYCDAIWVSEKPTVPWQCVSLIEEYGEREDGKPAIYAYGRRIRIMALDTRVQVDNNLLDTLSVARFEKEIKIIIS